MNRFVNIFSPDSVKKELEYLKTVTYEDVKITLSKEHISKKDFLNLISSAADPFLEEIARKSQRITKKRFGNIIQMYIPLYLSSECNNRCAYCGFRNDLKPEERKTLSLEEVKQEAFKIKQMGFSHVLLVSSASSKVTVNYLKEVIFILKDLFASVTVEIDTLSTDDYNALKQVGCDGVTIYQETYDPEIYNRVHLSGSKKD